jgi:citrate synthase
VVHSPSEITSTEPSTGRFLRHALDAAGEPPSFDNESAWDDIAVQAVNDTVNAGQLIPGLGHHLHKHGDPRTPAIVAIAREAGHYGPHLALFEAVGRVAPGVLGKNLPLNGAGACGAALADIDVPYELLRGVALLARCAGLLGHLAEELRTPIANQVFRTVESNAIYVQPSAD